MVTDQSAAANDPRLLKAIKNAEMRLSGQGRVLLRPSGTEPVLRLMVEGENEVQVEAILHELAAYINGSVKK
jgi:phosphoglucosamine mutase